MLSKVNRETVEFDVEQMPSFLTKRHIQKFLNIGEDGAYELMKSFPRVPILKRQFILKTDFRNWLIQKI